MEKEKRGAPPKYDEAFKSGAVKMVTESNRSVKEVAEQLGVYRETLISWLKKVGISRSSYYDSKSRKPSSRAFKNKLLLREIVQLHEKYPVYGLDSICNILCRKHCLGRA